MQEREDKSTHDDEPHASWRKSASHRRNEVAGLSAAKIARAALRAFSTQLA